MYDAPDAPAIGTASGQCRSALLEAKNLAFFGPANKLVNDLREPRGVPGDEPPDATSAAGPTTPATNPDRHIGSTPMLAADYKGFKLYLCQDAINSSILYR